MNCENFGEVMNQLQRIEDKLETIVNPVKKVYTNKTLAQYLGVHEKQLAKYREAGIICYTQVWGKFGYTQEDVDEFLLRYKYISPNR